MGGKQRSDNSLYFFIPYFNIFYNFKARGFQGKPSLYIFVSELDWTWGPTSLGSIGRLLIIVKRLKSWIISKWIYK